MPTSQEEFNYPYDIRSYDDDCVNWWDFITPIIRSSSVEMQKYIEVSSDLYRGVLPTDSLCCEFDSDFVPSKEFVAAAKALYQTLSAKIEALADSYARLKPEIPYYCETDLPWWVAASHGDRLAKGGWNHRIMNVIQFYCRNHGGCDLGDHSAKVLLGVFSGKIVGMQVEPPRPGGRRIKGPGL